MPSVPGASVPLYRRMAHYQPPVLLKLVLLIGFAWAANWSSGLFTGFGNQVLGVIGTTLLFLLFGSLGRVAYGLFTVIYVLLLCLQLAVKHFYGAIDLNLVLALRLTNAAESLGYLSDLADLRSIVLSVVLILVCCTFLIRIRVPIRNWYFTVACAVFLATVPIYRLQANNINVQDDNNYPVFLLNDIPSKVLATTYHHYESAGGLMVARGSYETPYNWSSFAGYAPKRLNVIIIGESSRADMYGANRADGLELTPCIDSTYSYNFSQCYSPASHTVNSLTRVLFLTGSHYRSIPQANIISLLKTAGVQCYWVSNQGFAGEHDSPFTALAMNCDSMYYYTELSSPFSISPDSILLPRIREIIAHARTNEKPICLIIHLMGSHPPMNNKPRAHGIPYTKDDALSRYMGSTQETDALIGEVLGAVRGLPDYNMFYFSDHGITYSKDRDYFVHADKYKENYHVPFMIWSSTDTGHVNSSRPVSLMGFLPILLQFNSGKSGNLDSLLGTMDSPLLVLDGNGQPTLVKDLPSNKINL